MTSPIQSPESALAGVDAYFARVPEPAHTLLEEMRSILRAAAPKEATEALSYSMPAFHLHGPLFSYAAFKRHISFFPMGAAAIEEFAEELKGLRVNKGTIHFPLDKPLPAALIKKMVRACVARNEAKSAKES